MNDWIFVRHGESTANADAMFSGHMDVPLTPRGLAQARAAGQTVRDRLGGTPLNAMWSSDLKRAHQTAVGIHEAAAFTVPIRTHRALREQHLGEWEGQPIATIRRAHPEQPLMAWDRRAPGGETLEEVGRRAVELLRTFRPDGPVCIVGHGGLLRVLIGLLDDVPATAIGSIRIPNAVPIVRRVTHQQWDRIARERLGYAPAWHH